jgi:outer membrane PBP1 activator LpoA protein
MMRRQLDFIRIAFLPVLFYLISVPVLAVERIVLLLPQSTPEQVAASNAIAAGVKEILAVPVMLVDRGLYADFARAWRAVLQLRPTAVVGPLHEDDVAALVGLDPKFPVLALNQTAKSHANIWQLSMRTELPVYQLALHLADKGVEKIVILSHQDAVSERLYQALLDVASAEMVDGVVYRQQNELAAATSLLLHSAKGRARVQALMTLLAQPLQGYPWVRQDADALVLVAPLADALTLSYQVDYLWGQALSLYWLDSGTNMLSDYVRSTSNWGRMKTFMPAYQLSAMQRRSTDSSFFRALGQDAGRLLQLRLGRDVWDDGSIIEGSLGELSMGDDNHIRVKLPLIWLGDGQADQVD